MKKPVRMLCSLLALVLGGVLAFCYYKASSYQSAFAGTSDGDTAEKVIMRFGVPDIRESRTAPYLRYAASACEDPCAERLWWEHPLLKGIEAWSVEVNNRGTVVHKAHWVSP